MTNEAIAAVDLQPRISLFLMMLGFQAATLATQSNDLRVEHTGTGNPSIKIFAMRGCKDAAEGNLIARAISCSKTRGSLRVTVPRVCTEDGGKMCLTLDEQNESCITISGKMNGRRLRSSEIFLDNITFFNYSAPLDYIDWNQQGNRSTLILMRPPGVSGYKLKLEAKMDKRDRCPSKSLAGKVHQDMVNFTAHWFEEFLPDCKYYAKFVAVNDCGQDFIDVDKLPPLQYNNPPKQEQTEEPGHMTVYAGVMAAFLAGLLVLTVFLYLKRRRLQDPSPGHDITQVKKDNLPAKLRPTILLVYTASLHQEMAALSTQLKKLTGLQIEDLYGVGDHDKLNDPIMWLNRRLMDVNTRFVLAVCPSSTSLTENSKPKEDPKQGVVFHFLLDHFLKHLQSGLAHDYTRLHQVSFKNQAETHLSDVTPGRLYRIPDHLNQLAHNLALGAPTPSTDKFSDSCKE